MQNFKHDLLVRDRIHQSVGAQQQKIPRLPLNGKVVCLHGGVRSQSTGNEIAAGMAAGLTGSQVTLFHHVLYQGMVPADLPQALSSGQIGPAVAHIADEYPISLDQGRYQRSAHASQLRMSGSPLSDSAVGCHYSGTHRLVRVVGVGQGADIRLHRYAAGDAAPGHTAHAVAHHSHGIAAGQLGKTKGILIFPAHQAGIGDLPMLHAGSPPFLSSIARRRSWPQEASMSPPRLRRTVAVMPCDSNRF